MTRLFDIRSLFSRTAGRSRRSIRKGRRRVDHSSQAESLEQRTLLTAELFLQGSSFVDANGNNEFDGGDVPKVGATIELYNSDGTSLLATTTTDANGGYVFDQTNFPGLVPGTYQITEIPTAGFVNSGVEILSDLNPAAGLSTDTIQVTLIDPTGLEVTVDVDELYSLNRTEVASSTVFGTTTVNSLGQIPASIDGLGLTSSIDFYTFCMDYYNQLGYGVQTYDVETNPTTTGPNTSPNAGRIAYLYNHYGRSLVSGSFTSNTPSVEAAGLQFAIYELLYDPGSVDLTGGNYSVAYNSAYSSLTSPTEFAAAVSAAEDFISNSLGKSEKAIFLNTPTFPATPGETFSQSVIISGSYNFANIPAAALGDFVWEDTNANGIQDPGEPGIEGVTVNLLDENMVPIPGATTTTDSSGAYSFTDLVPGNYIVQFVTPGGYVQTVQDVNNDGTNQDPNVDSDAGVDGKTAIITLSSGETDNTIDAGYYELAALGDFVWDDTNANGLQDPGEPGIEGVTVNLLDENMVPIPGATTTTDSNGAYSFTDLVPGNYIVQFVTPGGYVQTAQDVNNDGTNQDPNVDSDAGVDGKTAIITLSSGETDNTIDAGYYELAALGDFVWDDTNANGLQDPGEPGIEGVTVNLLDENMVPIPGATTTTDSNGAYSFTDLVPGNYIVQFVTPGGYVQTVQDVNNDGTNQDPNVDSDAGVDGKTAIITLSSGETDNTIDAGYYVSAAINIEKLVREAATPGGGEGLTPGYWKQSHHFDDWTTYSPGDSFNQIFMVNDPDSPTLLEALQRGGGDNNALGRHAVAAILNAANTNIDYDLSFSQIKAAVQDAYDTGDFEPIKNQLDNLNNQGADLTTPAGNGTPGPWLDADSPTGPLVDVGGTVEFLYVVSIPDHVTLSLSNVTVVDDNTTPNDTIDDFYPDAVLDEFFKNVGDTDGDGLLDPGEEWLFTAMSIVTEGQHVNNGTATGQPVDSNGDAIGSPVSDDDVAHWFGTDDISNLSLIEGIVWADLNDDGAVDSGESGISGVTVQLTGTNASGETVNRVAVTDSDGHYVFAGLDPSDANGYMIEEIQPAGYDDGKDSVGTVAGNPVGVIDGNDKFSGVVLQPGQDGINYNFGELPTATAGEFLTSGQTATIGFWHNKNGQALIESLNGGPAATQLSNWLATEFPNLYGPASGDNDLTNKTNAEVADHFTAIFKTKKAKKAKGSGGPTKLDPQVMAVAFAIYVTDTDLAGTVAQNYGFTTSPGGTGAANYDIDQSVGSGTAETLFGDGTPSVMTVMEIMKRTDAASLTGIVFADGDGLGLSTLSSLEKLQRSLLNVLLTSINEDGDI